MVRKQEHYVLVIRSHIHRDLVTWFRPLKSFSILTIGSNLSNEEIILSASYLDLLKDKAAREALQRFTDRHCLSLVASA